MSEILKIIEQFKLDKIKNQTLICYLYSVVQLSQEEILKLCQKNNIFINIHEITSVITIYLKLLESNKISNNLKNELKDFRFIDGVDLFFMDKIYHQYDYLDFDECCILATKKIAVEQNQDCFFSTQKKHTEEKKSTYYSIDEVATNLQIAPSKIFLRLHELGWIEKNGLFQWKITEKSKQLGIRNTDNDILNDKIWPQSFFDAEDFTSLIDNNNLEIENLKNTILTKEEIEHPAFDHEKVFLNYIPMIVSGEIERDSLGHIVDLYYDLYDPDGNDRKYEFYYDKYSEIYDSFDRIQDLYLSLDKFRGMTSDDIVNAIENFNEELKQEKVEKSIIDEGYITVMNIAQKTNLSHDEILSILSGFELIENNGTHWVLTDKGESYGVHRDKDEILWKESIVNYIFIEGKKLMFEVFNNIEDFNKLFNKLNTSQQEILISLLNPKIEIEKRRI